MMMMMMTHIKIKPVCANYGTMLHIYKINVIIKQFERVYWFKNYGNT